MVYAYVKFLQLHLRAFGRDVQDWRDAERGDFKLVTAVRVVLTILEVFIILMQSSDIS